MNFKIVLIILSGIFCFSCQKETKIDFEKERKIILELEEKAREYHFSKNAKALVDSFSEDFISINKGNIEKPAYQDSYQKFDSYFKSVKFIKWDNNEEPIVRFSDDASIAYVAVDKLVVVEWENEIGEKVLDSTNFAWLSVFKKVNNQWKLDCIISTNKS